MSNNIYGGITYPNSPFSFDRTYDNYKMAMDNAANDGILIGRYILITYCDDVLSYGERYDLDRYVIEGVEPPPFYYIDLRKTKFKEPYNTYVKNFEQDKNFFGELTNSYDRMVFQKVYKNNKVTYIQIVSLSLSLSETTHAVAGVDEENNSILTLNDNKQLSSYITLEHDTVNKKIKLIGPSNKILGNIPTDSFIADGIFKDVSYDTNKNTIKFEWVTPKGEEKNVEVPLNEILDPYTSGYGVNVDNTNLKINIHLDKSSADAEGFLKLSENGLKVSGIQNAIDTTVDKKVKVTQDQVDTIQSNVTTLNEQVNNLNIALADEIQISETAEAMENTATMQIVIDGDNGDGQQGPVYVLELENYDTRDEVNDKIDTAIQNLETSVTNEVSGEFLTITDASSIEHIMDVKVRSKNLFNISKIDDITHTGGTIQKTEDNILIIEAAEGYGGTVHCGKLLRELAPELEVGKTYTISFVSTNTATGEPSIDQKILLIAADIVWNNGSALTITDIILDSKFTFYTSGSGTSATISNIQIEEGTIATDYTPYVDVSKITLNRCSKNLFSNDISLIKPVSFNRADGTLGNYYGYEIHLPTGKYRLSATTDASLYVYGAVVRNGVNVNSSSITDRYNGSSACIIAESTNYTPILYTLEGDGNIIYIYDAIGFHTLEQAKEVFSKVSIQLEMGEEVTEFESSKLIQYTPGVDGIVEGVTSLYLITNLFTNTEGVLIDCEYIQTMGFDYGAEQVLANSSKIQQLEERFASAEQNVQADWSVEDSTSDAYIKNKPSIPTNISDLTNDTGYLSGTVAITNGGTGATTTEEARANLKITPANIGAAAVGDVYNKTEIDNKLNDKVTISKDGEISILPTTQDIKNSIDNIPYNVSISSTTENITDDSVIKKYIITQGSKEVGTIDIPKDLVVIKGSVETVKEVNKPYENAKVGDKYIQLELSSEDVLYIPANDLVDIYTASNAENATVNITINENNQISAELSEGTKQNLADMSNTMNSMGEAYGLLLDSVNNKSEIFFEQWLYSTESEAMSYVGKYENGTFITNESDISRISTSDSIIVAIDWNAYSNDYDEQVEIEYSNIYQITISNSNDSVQLIPNCKVSGQSRTKDLYLLIKVVR